MSFLLFFLLLLDLEHCWINLKLVFLSTPYGSPWLSSSLLELLGFRCFVLDTLSASFTCCLS